MYSVNKDFDSAINNYYIARDFELFVYINNVRFDSEKIFSLKFVESSSSGDSITMGEALSNYIELEIADTGISLNGATIKVNIGLYNSSGTLYQATLPLGTFYVSEFKRKDKYKTVELTAYDKIALMNVEYVPTVEFPTNCATVWNDIAAQFSLTAKTDYLVTTDDVITNISCTVREMLGYVAGLNGCNARINRDGALTLLPYATDSTYIFEDCLSDYTLENDAFNITALVSGEGENEIKSGSGQAITFANPFMTQTILDNLVAERLPYTYRAAEVKFSFYNPEYEVGDRYRILINGMTGDLQPYIYVMKQEITFDGGFSATIKSYGISENAAVISNFKSDTVTLERNISKIEKMQNTIIGSNGGYFDVLLDENDSWRPYGTAWWKDTSKTTGWKFTYGGLGFFNSNTLQKIAITNDGSVLADNIEANSILTNSFKIGKSDSDYAMSFDGSTGKISFGSGVSMSWADITDTPTIPSKTSEITNDSGYITDGDIPSKTSQLTNDSGYINSSTATTITNNAISTATIRADQVSAGSFYITGGYINIDTGVDDTNTIRLVGSSRYTEMGPGGLYTAFNDGTYRAFVDAQTGFYVGDGSGNSGGLTTEVLSLSGISLYNQNGHFMFSNTVEPEGSFNWDLGSDSYYWNNVYCYSVNQISDRNFKEDITPLATKYVDLFDKLNPVSFKFKGANRTHTGFVAQDVESAMTEVGLTSSEFAGFYKSSDDVCGLRYTEFIALLTAKVQQLENRIEVLENGQTTND